MKLVSLSNEKWTILITKQYLINTEAEEFTNDNSMLLIFLNQVMKTGSVFYQIFSNIPTRT